MRCERFFLFSFISASGHQSDWSGDDVLPSEKLRTPPAVRKSKPSAIPRNTKFKLAKTVFVDIEPFPVKGDRALSSNSDKDKRRRGSQFGFLQFPELLKKSIPIPFGWYKGIFLDLRNFECFCLWSPTRGRV